MHIFLSHSFFILQAILTDVEEGEDMGRYSISVISSTPTKDLTDWAPKMTTTTLTTPLTTQTTRSSPSHGKRSRRQTTPPAADWFTYITCSRHIRLEVFGTSNKLIPLMWIGSGNLVWRWRNNAPTHQTFRT